MRYTFGRHGVCTYCGNPADCVDHTIPYSWFRNTGGNSRKQESVGFMTYSCRECNGLLGSRLFPTFQERLLYVQRRLRSKYKKYMGVLWDKEDLSGVSGRLKQYIRQQLRLNLAIRKRLSWPESPDFQDMMQEVYDDIYYDASIMPAWKEYFIDTDYVPRDGRKDYYERRSK